MLDVHFQWVSLYYSKPVSDGGLFVTCDVSVIVYDVAILLVFYIFSFGVFVLLLQLTYLGFAVLLLLLFSLLVGGGLKNFLGCRIESHGETLMGYQTETQL